MWKHEDSSLGEAPLVENSPAFLNLSRESQNGFTTVLASAACEWFLILLLLIDSALSFIAIKFAHYCKLEAPCILCTRLDLVVGGKGSQSYRNLLCANHRDEISSLFSCQIHGNLVDGLGMCEECLCSSLARIKSCPETHNFLLRKLGVDNPFLKRDSVPLFSETRSCACCGKPWVPGQKAHRLLQLKPSGPQVSKPNVPLPPLPGRGPVHRRDSVRKMRDKLCGSVSLHSQRFGKNGFDPLPNVGYTELRINSDSESEVLFSDDYDDGDGTHIVQRKNELKDDAARRCCASAKLYRASSEGVVFSYPEPLLSEPREIERLTSEAILNQDSIENKMQQVDQKTLASEFPELISLDDFPPLSDPVDVSNGMSPEKREVKFPLSTQLGPASPELTSHVDAPLHPFIPVESEKLGTMKSINGMHASEEDHEENLNAGGTEKDVASQFNQIADNPISVKSNFVSAVDHEQSYVCAMGSEQTTKKGSYKNDEITKPLEGQSCIPLGIDSSSNVVTLEIHHSGEEQQLTNLSSLNGTPVLHNLLSDERTNSGILSLYESTTSTSLGESVIDQLRRQVEFGDKCVSELYKELEEERNASMVAANEAMAMITRLQEEKAALHMEALQYLRMMEEQAEYDMEALEKANDLLAEREKFIQDLEAELDFYRLHFSDESTFENMPEAGGLYHF